MSHPTHGHFLSAAAALLCCVVHAQTNTPDTGQLPANGGAVIDKTRPADPPRGASAPERVKKKSRPPAGAASAASAVNARPASGTR